MTAGRVCCVGRPPTSCRVFRFGRDDSTAHRPQPPVVSVIDTRLVQIADPQAHLSQHLIRLLPHQAQRIQQSAFMLSESTVRSSCVMATTVISVKVESVFGRLHAVTSAGPHAHVPPHLVPQMGSFLLALSVRPGAALRSCEPASRHAADISVQ
jgi:hypothetical protein